MAKSPAAKTNGHTVAALKAAAPRKAVAAKPARKAAAKAPVKAAAVAKAAPAAAAKKTVTRPVAKAPRKPVAKAVAAKPAVAKPAVAKPAAAKPAAAKPAAVKPAAAKTADAAAVSGSDAPDGARDKVRKAKLVRDSFTMPEQEYAVLGQVKKACIKAGFEIKKSELLRIGVALISQLDMATLQNVLTSLPQLKTGRPKND